MRVCFMPNVCCYMLVLIIDAQAKVILLKQLFTVLVLVSTRVHVLSCEVKAINCAIFRISQDGGAHIISGVVYHEH